jgi:integrase
MRSDGVAVRKSTSTAVASKPVKPYPDFPLSPHATGRWCKKVRGTIRFFGRWGHKVGDQIVPVDDVPASAALAKIEFDRQWPWISRGLPAPPAQAVDDSRLILKELCNRFLTSKVRKVNTGHLSPRTLPGYRAACDLVIETFGKSAVVADLKPADFERLLEKISTGRHPGGTANFVRHIRILFKWAFDNFLVDRPVRFGPDFKTPSKRLLRGAEQRISLEHGKRLLTAPELRKLLKHLQADGRPASLALRAMVLLGVNCGFGQTDVANLQVSHLDLKRGWVDFPRVKTAIDRRCPLWPETVAALKVAISTRPKPKDPGDDQFVFITRIGQKWVTVSEKGGVTDTVGACFTRVLRTLNLKRQRVNFYSLRRATETHGGDVADQVAVDFIMGHCDASMAARYREGILDNRLRAVTDHLRKWLFKGKH